AAGGHEPSWLLVCDLRVARLDALPAALTRGATACHAFDGDPSRLWQAVLEPAWRGKRPRVVGVSGHAARFLLAELARPYGYRLVARDELGDAVSWVLAAPPAA
ncbi:MAG: hypothetical protein ACU85V_07280, partial [Gammaproteobacteria bacterium]